MTWRCNHTADMSDISQHPSLTCFTLNKAFMLTISVSTLMAQLYEGPSFAVSDGHV